MSRLSLQQLKDKTGVTDDKLAMMCSDAHLKELAEHIEDYGKFAHVLELKGWQISEIKTDLNMNYAMKTYAVLKHWKSENAFRATYERLLSAVLSVGEGVLAVKICELCKQCMEGESASGPLLPTPTPLSDKEQDIYRQMRQRIKVTDVQLAQPCSGDHLKQIAQEIDNFEPFAEVLQIKGWRITEIKTDVNLSYMFKTLAVLEQWRQDNPFEATYENLIIAALKLRQGTVAAKICQVAKEVTVLPTMSTSSSTDNCTGTQTHSI